MNTKERNKKQKTKAGKEKEEKRAQNKCKQTRQTHKRTRISIMNLYVLFIYVRIIVMSRSLPKQQQPFRFLRALYHTFILPRTIRQCQSFSIDGDEYSIYCIHSSAAQCASPHPTRAHNTRHHTTTRFLRPFHIRNPFFAHHVQRTYILLLDALFFLSHLHIIMYFLNVSMLASRMTKQHTLCLCPPSAS